MSNQLWQEWQKTARVCGDKTVWIEAETNASWSARDLSRWSEKFLDELILLHAGERVGFTFSGISGMALFLALQRAGLVAVPLDAGLPQEGLLDLVKRLQIRALYWNGVFRFFDGRCDKDRTHSFLKITSGSSQGDPKIIKCRAEHLMVDGQQIIRGMGLRRTDRHLAVIPLGHSYGLGSLVMPLIIQGATLVVASQFVLRQLTGWIDQFQTSVFPGVPALFRSLAALPGKDPLPSLRLAVSAGAPLQAEVARAFFDRYSVKLHNFYGSSETGGISYDRTGSASLSGRSVGKPLAGVAVTIQQGQIVVKSPAVATRNGAWKLPDSGEWNARRELVILGRVGQSANVGGKKVNPVEVERVLRSNASVTDVGVWVLQKNGRDYLAAAVETNLSQDQIERYLSSHLPIWKMPRRFFIAHELPRSARGKLDATRLRQRLAKS